VTTNVALPTGGSPHSGPGAGRILVIDDEAGIREILTDVLRTNGYAAQCAEDGEAGWAALEAQSFDLVITDHEMPRLTGADLLRRMRANHLHRHLPVILISGRLVWPDPELLPLLPPGVAMEKPFVWAELMTNARRLLSASVAEAGGRDTVTSTDRKRRTQLATDMVGANRRRTADRARR
jgi:DNA-binding response OmpR family regulator